MAKGNDKTEKAAAARKKRQFDRTMIGLAILAIIVLTVLQTKVVRLGAGVSTSHSVLVFLIINLNILLLFLLLVLVLRNLYKIFFEQKQFFGAQLRTKLVVAFVSLSLVPTGLLFYAALQFITTGQDLWRNESMEISLIQSQDLGRDALERSERLALDFGDRAAGEFLERRLHRPELRDELDAWLRDTRAGSEMSLIEVYGPDLESIAGDRAESFDEKAFSRKPAAEVFASALAERRPIKILDGASDGDLIRVVTPLFEDNGEIAAFLVVGYRTALPFSTRLARISEGLETYRRLKMLQDPVKVSHYIALTIVALLSMFVSTWIGFHLAKGITGPIMDLAEATDRIAHGDYDVTIDAPAGAGEILTLVESFNRMTRDLKAGRAQLTEKNLELLDMNAELDQRRRHMEIILQNVAAGVISADADGVVTTINRSATEILRLPARAILDRPFTDVMAPAHKAIVDELSRAAAASPRGSADKQIKVKIGDRVASLHVHLSRLLDEQGAYLGMVLVFDDQTEVEKAQRMAAWREVARRIAHEIKNPLTPIQLSTQRLRRRYADRLGDEDKLFDECTQMIIRQVDELKRLVGEFSNFARLPEANPLPNDLTEIIEETLVMYQNRKGLEIVFDKNGRPPVFNLDREQIKRALINLMDNAVASVDEQGRIDVRLSYDRPLKMARIEVADNGAGVAPADKPRLFEPYFSTKKSGTGLGLSIVSTIIADHDGFVRVQDNEPRGARFVIELPVKS
jgi:two-component system nitrogen regulation sensor histidine kinase NtrY